MANDTLQRCVHALNDHRRAQTFFHDTLLNLLTSENEPHSDVLTGAMVVSRWFDEHITKTINLIQNQDE